MSHEAAEPANDRDRAGAPAPQDGGPAADPAEVLLRSGGAQVVVRPDEGCRISSLSVDGTELLLQGDGFGSFVMAPWCGRQGYGRFRNGPRTHRLPVNAGEHSIHGTVRDQTWRTAHRPSHGRSAAFVVELADPWPYRGSVTQTVELAEDGGSLTLGLSVETVEDSFPAQAGWHPWFRRRLRPDGPEVRIAFDAAHQLERGPDGLPNGREISPRPGPWDDCFAMPDGVDATLTWPGDVAVRLTSTARWAVVFDEREEAVCVEPQSGPPNGLTSHPRLVTPIEPLEVRTTWSWSRPDDG